MTVPVSKPAMDFFRLVVPVVLPVKDEDEILFIVLLLLLSCDGGILMFSVVLLLLIREVTEIFDPVLYFRGILVPILVLLFVRSLADKWVRDSSTSDGTERPCSNGVDFAEFVVLL